MPLDIRTIETLDGSDVNAPDRVQVYLKKQVANAAGGGAGQTVTTAISNLQLPAKYAVIVSGLSQDATAYVTGRTQTGFSVVLAPRLAANTLAIGTFDLLVVA
jgi:hypothetical protein